MKPFFIRLPITRFSSRVTRVICLVVMVFLSALVAGNYISSMERSSIKILSVLNNGQIHQIKTGENLLLIVPNPGSGGYVFQYPPEFNPRILKLLKTERRPPADTEKAGDFGTSEWTFQAAKEGISPIVVRAFRPWEKMKTPVEIFKVSIIVNP